jgi:hypothetical protein
VRTSGLEKDSRSVAACSSMEPERPSVPPLEGKNRGESSVNPMEDPVVDVAEDEAG